MTNCAYQRAQLRALDEHGEPIIAADDMLCSSFASVARGHNVLAKSALERGLTNLSFSSISPVVVIMVTPAAKGRVRV